uniref:Uncharacterized protein n=2 Tax=Felis catus TaxID=9685 RepID=A0ABI7ZNI8_FELCA
MVSSPPLSRPCSRRLQGAREWLERRMASTPTRNEEEKGSRMSQAATSLGGGPVSMGVSLSRSEEFLTQISTELTDEALFTAGYGTNPVPTKEKQTQDRGTQISKHGDPTSRTTVSRDPTIPLVPIPDPSQPQLSSPAISRLTALPGTA